MRKIATKTFVKHAHRLIGTQTVSFVTKLDQFSTITMKALVGLLLIFAYLCSNQAYAATYLFVGPSSPSTWVDISTTGTTVALADDSVSAAVPLGFTFNFAGTNYTQLRIGSNGWQFFAGTSNAFANTSVATSGVTNTLMPYWGDLNPNSVATRIRYQTIGTAPNRQFVVSYLNVPTFNATGSNTFQVIIYENGRFQYNYQVTNTQGLLTADANEGATVGYIVSTTDLVQFSLNTASVPNNTSLTWYIAPSLTHLKTVATVSDPINNTTGAKNIPGALVQYTINISNTSAGIVDNNTTSITDPIPVNTELFTGGLSAAAPFTFTDGAPTSGLTCTFIALASTSDCVQFSNNNGISWTYTPSAVTDYDATVTNIRFVPTGTLSGDTAPAAAPFPNFSLIFRVRVK